MADRKPVPTTAFVVIHHFAWDLATSKVYLREALEHSHKKSMLCSCLCFIFPRVVPGAAVGAWQRGGRGTGGAAARDAAVPLPAGIPHCHRERRRHCAVPPPRLGSAPALHQYVLSPGNSSIDTQKSPAGGSLPESHCCAFFPGITCSTLSEVAHGGFYPVKKTYEEGDVVHFFCDKHYSVTGFDLIQCYNFGWYPDPPVCEGTLLL